MEYVLERIFKPGSRRWSKDIVLNERRRSYTCGRGKENHIQCLSMIVSHKHCIFFHGEDGLYVLDLQSSNGIFINGQRQKALQMVKLYENDIIGIGCFNLKNNDMYMYRVYYVIKNTYHSPEEERENILSKTLLNNNEMKRASVEVLTDHNLMEGQSNSNEDCSIIVPCKISKYKDNDFHDSRISNSTETAISYSRTDQNDQSLCINIDDDNDNNDDDDDDIEIIHTSFAYETKANFSDRKRSSDNWRFDCDTSQRHNSELSEDYTKEIVRMNIDEDENRNKNNNPADRPYAEGASSSLDKTNCAVYISKTPDLTYIEDEIINLEDEEITDDEEQAHAAINMETTCDAPLIRLKKVKHELKTEFSKIDVVDLSDDEDNVFPYSQFFDITYKNDAPNKIEIKEEHAGNDQKIGLLNVNDEVCVLTDDEDEYNPWLERLSRSQLLRENKEPTLMDTVVKDEVDLGIWENDEFSNVIQFEVPHELPDSKETLALYTSEENHVKDNTDLDSSVMKIIDSMEVSDNEGSNQISLVNDTNKCEIDTGHAEPNETTKIPDNLTTEPCTLTKELKILSIESLKPRCSVTTSKKLIPIIEPQSLPVRKKNQVNLVSKETKEELLQSTSMSKRKTQILKEKIYENFVNNKRPKHKPLTTSAINSSSKIISKKERKNIIEKRKQKLKEIAEEKKKLNTESEKIVKRGTAKPRAKVSLKNRGDFLITEEENAVSKSPLNKSVKPKDNQTKDLPTTRNVDVQKCTTFDTKTQKSHQENLSKSINVVSFEQFLDTSLKESLALSIESIVRVTEENDTWESKSVDKEKNNEDRMYKISNNCGAKTSELRDKSTERPSILVQKENFSPNSANTEKSKFVYDRVRSSANSTKERKNVSFSEKVEIKYYEIETQNSLKRLTGKDAPISTNKLAKTLTTNQYVPAPKLEEFLWHILLWNPVWLEEQRYLEHAPPILSNCNYEPQPMKLYYVSYEQYYAITMPLLLLEIWYIISKDFDNVDKNKQRVTAMCSIIQNSITYIPIPSTNLFLTTLTIEVLIEKENKQAHPIYGDLVSFEYVTNGQGRQIFHKVFAYVVNMHETIITDGTRYNNELNNYVQKPYAVVTYTLMMRSLEHGIMNRAQRVRTVTYLRASIRMVQALQHLSQSSLLNLILNPKIQDYQLSPVSKSFVASSSRMIEDNLNPKQLEAVYKVSNTVLKKEAKLCFIQGPPGTGKSKVIVNLVSRILYDKQDKKSLRILVCAPSNAAIDEIVVRLLAIRSTFKPKRFNMVRIGRPEFMHSAIKSISVTELARRYIMQASNKINKNEITDLQTRIHLLQNTLASSHGRIKKSELEQKLVNVRAKYEILKLLDGCKWDELDAKMQAKVLRLSEDFILKGADVITCTLSSCYTNQMESVFSGHKDRISVCIVDEATQSCEAETLIPLMLGVNTLVLVGDPNQLPATVLSQDAKKLGLDQSIFSRIQNIFALQENNPIIMLDTQYRMDYSISYWPNNYFYNGKLKNDAQLRMRFPFHAYRVINHNSAQNDDKYSNTTEAVFVANIIFTMLTLAKWDNVDENVCVSIGVLTPYSMQKSVMLNKINEKISPLPETFKKKFKIEVNTVDSFQGQERDVIIMSCVRSHGIGFLSDKQRLCVALTRAKHSLIICGNFNTFMKNSMWKALVTDAQSRGVFCKVDAAATPIEIQPFIVK